METCKRYRIVYHLLPFRAVRGALIETHMRSCPDCQSDLSRIEETKQVTVSAAEMNQHTQDQTPFDVSLITEKPPKISRWLPVRLWALGTAGAVSLALLAVFLLVPATSPDNSENRIPFRIDFAKINEEPAQAIIFQTQDRFKTFVWIEKQSKGVDQ